MMARDNEQIVRRRLLYNYLDYSRPCLPLRHFTEIQANSYRGSSMIRLMFPATTSDRKSFLYPIILLLVLFLPAISHPVVAAPAIGSMGMGSTIDGKVCIWKPSRIFLATAYFVSRVSTRVRCWSLVLVGI